LNGATVNELFQEYDLAQIHQFQNAISIFVYLTECPCVVPAKSIAPLELFEFKANKELKDKPFDANEYQKRRKTNKFSPLVKKSDGRYKFKTVPSMTANPNWTSVGMFELLNDEDDEDNFEHQPKPKPKRNPKRKEKDDEEKELVPKSNN
jgi:hypothetical protein